MTQFNFGDDLANELKNAKGGQAKRPLNTWYINPITIGEASYYLHIEKLTGLPIITRKLSSFSYVFANVLHEMGFLTPKQQDRIAQELTESIQYRYNPDENSPMLATYRQCIRDHQEVLLLGIENSQQGLPENVLMCNLSLALCSTLGDGGNRVFKSFCRVVNEIVPIKILKPRPGTSYCTITPHFRDPRDWQEFVGQEPQANPQVVSAIKENNQKMIDQFFETEYGEQIVDQETARTLLADFLNDSLLNERIDLITTNLASASIFYWSILIAGSDTSLMVILNNFYTFLCHAGIVNKPAAEHVVDNLQVTLDTYLGNNHLPYEQMREYLADNSALMDDYYDFIQNAIDEGEFPESFRETLLAGSNKLEQDHLDQTSYINSTRVRMTYKVKVTLADFKPQMFREFYIAGSRSIEELELAIIYMFHGDGEHAFDLINKRDGDYYAIPELLDEDFLPHGGYNVLDASKATVSRLKQGDRLFLTYDFGDDWRFNITVEELIQDYVGYQPMISVAQGYGIIEDIGGTSGLKDYYRDFKRGRVDPDIKEWFGEIINLDSVNVNELNQRLRELDE